VTGTGGAKQTTPVTGNGQGGNANNTPGSNPSASGGTGTGGSGGSGGAGTSGGQPVYDDNGNVVSGSGTGTTYGAAVSKPFTLSDQAGAGTQWMMVASALLLVAVVVVPPLVAQRLRRGGSDAGR
jgi:hypothetical protein